ncbi:hypothetical protein, partial [Pantoea sp. GM01]|uniref:hypothetical protein n=1 Tax=Pantoea sp. GM01 TaxID=1144320 RepID=UPI001EE65339
GFGFWVLGFGFWVLGFGFWVLGFGFGVWGLGFGVLGWCVLSLIPAFSRRREKEPIERFVGLVIT